MKITVTDMVEEINYLCISQGNVFKHGNTYYIKVYAINGSSHRMNAVRLEDGYLHWFEDGDKVISVNAELNVSE